MPKVFCSKHCVKHLGRDSSRPWRQPSPLQTTGLRNARLVRDFCFGNFKGAELSPLPNLKITEGVQGHLSLCDARSKLVYLAVSARQLSIVTDPAALWLSLDPETCFSIVSYAVTTPKEARLRCRSP